MTDTRFDTRRSLRIGDKAEKIEKYEKNRVTYSTSAIYYYYILITIRWQSTKACVVTF